MNNKIDIEKLKQSHSETAWKYTKEFSRFANVCYAKGLFRAGLIGKNFSDFTHETPLRARVIGVAGSGVLLGGCVPVAHYLFQNFLRVAISHPSNSAIVMQAFINYASFIILNAVLFGVNAALCKDLKNYLSHKVREKNSHIWFEQNSFYGIQLSSDAQKIIPAEMLINKVQKYCNEIVDLFKERIYIFSTFLGAFVSLYNASTLLIIVSLIYSYLYNQLVLFLTINLKEQVKEEEGSLNDLRTLSTSIHAQAEKIAFDNPSRMLCESTYEMLNKKVFDISSKDLLSYFSESFLKKMHWEFSVVIGALTQILQGEVDPTTLVNIGTSFYYVVKQFTWVSEERSQHNHQLKLVAW